MAKEKETPPTPSDKDWRDEWFEKHGVTEDEDKSFLKSRELADEYVDEARKRRTPAPEKKSKKLFGGRSGRD